MNKTNKSDRLAAAMVNEAAAMPPAFSPELHQRILQRIQLNNAEPTPKLRRLNWKPVFVAISGGIAAMTIFWVGRPQPATHVNTGFVRLPSLPPLQNPVATFSGPVGDSLADARFAYLDRDARNVMRYMADQVDVLPNRR